MGLRAGTGAVFHLQRMAERDGGVNPSECPISHAGDQARRDIVQYIEMEYNSNRLHSTLGYITPREHQMAVAA